MSKAIRIAILLAVFNLGGCCPSDCEDIAKHFDINGFSASVRQITTTYSDGSFLHAPLDSTATVDFDRFVIELIPTMTFYGDNSKFNRSYFNNPFVNAAFACKCNGPGYEGSLERISDILIFSSYPFTELGATADTLSHYFDIAGLEGSYGYLRPVDLETFTATTPLALREIQLKLKVKPSGSLKQKFTVQYKQTNGEVYTLTTPTVEFKP